MPKPLKGNYTPTQKLYYALFDKLPKRDITEDEMPELFRVLETLTDQEAAIIKMHFGLGCEAMTLRAIGRNLEVHDSQIGRIEIRAIRKLRHPSRSRRIQPLFYTYAELQAQIAKCNEQVSCVNDHLQSVIAENASLHKKLWVLRLPLSAMDLEIKDMNFSDSKYNSLRRAGLDTAGDIALLYQKAGLGGLLKIRQIGPKSAQAILAKLQELGVMPSQAEETQQ
ncbi:hypothetical protein FWG76_00430 [Candidatus Saccharibacteria bacterium]|nr:hypothetical protein [Candidatus Saccharibacteria bacterium]